MENKARPGERVFTLLLLILGVYISIESWKMYQEAPTLAGHGTVPLICGILLTVMSIYAMIRVMLTPSEIKGLPMGEKAVAVVKLLFSRDVIITLAMVLAYCISLAVGVPFIIASPIYLWVNMVYLRRGDFVKNILFTAIVFAFVYVVFHIGFGVVLP